MHTTEPSSEAAINQRSAANVSEESSSLEISFRDIIDFFLRYFKILVLTGFVFGVLGIAYSFTRNRLYKAEMVILPEMGTNEKRGLSALAMGLASLGLNTGGDKDAVRPDLYPSIINSTECYRYVIQQPVRDKNGVSYPTLGDYLKSLNEKSDKEPGFISKLFKSATSSSADSISFKLDRPGILELSREEVNLLKWVGSLISSSLELRSGVITISAQTRDPIVTSQVLDFVSHYLTDFVTTYRQGKVKDQYEFLDESIKTAKAQMETARWKLQNYRDQNRNPFLNTARIEEQKLLEEYNIAQTTYQELAREWSQMGLKVNNVTPVYQVLEPNIVPYAKSYPKRLQMGITFAFFGVILMLFYLVVFKEQLPRKLYQSL